MEICKGDVVEFRMVTAREFNGLLYGQLLVDNEPAGFAPDCFAVDVEAVVANHGQYFPAIKEPTGFGAVVETDNGFMWVKVDPVVLERWTNGVVNVDQRGCQRDVACLDGPQAIWRDCGRPLRWGRRLRIRTRYANAHTFHKPSIFQDSGKMWVVVGPGIPFMGHVFAHWEDALAYALRRV